MNILEKDLEDLIWNAIQDGKFDLLEERGLELDTVAKFYRQPIINDCIPDVVSVSVSVIYRRKIDRYLYTVNLSIIELKRQKINMQTFEQILRYYNSYLGLFEVFKNKYQSSNRDFDLDYKLIMIGTDISKSESFLTLAQRPNIELYTTKLDLEKGVVFDRFIDNEAIDNSFDFSQFDLKIARL